MTTESLPMLRVGILGYGYWGPNLARNVSRSPRAELTRIADLDERRLQNARGIYPGIDLSQDPESVTRASDIDAVVIATPIGTHFELAQDALRSGKHVLVEKPMTHSADTSERLLEEARKNNVKLMVDHTFAYTESVRWIREFVDSGKLGELYYFDSVRANLGLFQRDASVLWDLAPHDLSILHELVPRRVISVTASGACHAGSRVPDIAYLTLDLADGCLAHFHVSWLSPVKIRRIMLAGSQKMVLFDDLEASEKIKVYDSGVRIEHEDSEGAHRMMVDYRIGDMFSPALPGREALAVEIDHFVDCCLDGGSPQTDGEAGLAVVRILEAAQQSLNKDGERVRL